MGRVLPVLFNTDMVKAVLDGRKTVTRRIVKYKYDNTEMKMRTDKYGTRLIEIQKDTEGETHGKNPDGSTWHKLLPYIEKNPPYKKGDILYVQETWKIHAVNPSCCMMIRYKADNYCNIQVKFYPSRFDTFQKFYEKNGWQSPYFMPKEAARIWLQVTDVRAERLHDMVSDDCLKEGIRFYDCPAGFTWKSDTDMKNCYTDALGAMNALWDSTVKKTDAGRYGWDANPWVWVIEFERCGKPEGEE